MNLVTQETIDSLYEIIKQSFQCNRTIDRMVSVLGVKFACNKSANLIHLGLAHAFPLIADEFGEKCLERYNISIEYGSTTDGKQDYDSVEQLILDLRDVVIEYHTNCMGVANTALENKDFHVYADVIDILEDINKLVEQVILLADKVIAYNGDNMSFDNHVGSFWILD